MPYQEDQYTIGESLDEKQQRFDAKESQKQAIINFITEKGITYPTEIMRNVGLHRQRTYDLLWELSSEGKIEKHFVPDTPDELFRPRLAQLWQQGIKGIELFRRISWFKIKKMV